MLNKYRKSGDITFIKKFELMNIAEQCFFFSSACEREIINQVTERKY